MSSYLQQFVNSLTKPKTYLLIGNVLLVFFLIILNNLGVLPFKNFGDFTFFAILTLALALYRPGWAFLFFVGTIALENINVAPKGFFVDIRPYQLFGAITIVALAIRHFAGRLNFKLIKLRWFDYLIILMALSGFASSIFGSSTSDSIAPSLKLSLIFASFAMFYFLIRNYIQTLEDLKKIIPFFLSSSAVVVFYGIWQNTAFIKGWNSFEVMPGRPNATFTEPDWLGIYVTLLIAVMYSIIYYCHSERSVAKSRNLLGDITNFDINNKLVDYREQIPRLRPDINVWPSLGMTGLYILLVPVYILSILTVSRSAWLGAGIVTLIFLKIILTETRFNPKYWQWKEFAKHFGLIILTLIISLFCVYIFHLTNFQLFNRATSSASGLQKITIACDCRDALQCVSTGMIIKNTSELNQYNCRHINLEEIEKEKAIGKYITEIYRPDPNANIRKEIYQKSIAEIKKHPVFGIGWGNIGKILGTDERGTVLNSSNIFLEIWLGSGIVGLLAFLVILVYILLKSLRGLFSDDFERKLISTFIILSFFALLIPNMLNAGIFLGILWVFLGISVIKK